MSDSQWSTQGKCWWAYAITWKLLEFERGRCLLGRNIAGLKNWRVARAGHWSTMDSPVEKQTRPVGKFPNTNPCEPSISIGDFVTHLSGGGFHFLNKPSFHQGLSQSVLDTTNTSLTCPRRAGKSQCKERGPEEKALRTPATRLCQENPETPGKLFHTQTAACKERRLIGKDPDAGKDWRQKEIGQQRTR